MTEKGLTILAKQGKLRPYARAGERKHYADLDELEELREFRPLPRSEEGPWE